LGYYLASIYDWYKVDFGGNQRSLIKHLRKYANSKLAKRLQRYKGSIAYDYNWNLNKP
jgi:hypothetical protein